MSTNAAEMEEKEIEVVEARREEAPEAEVSEDAAEEENQSSEKKRRLSEYSKSVQQRINKITHKYREEEAQRKRVDFAEDVKKQNDDFETSRVNWIKSYVGEFGTQD